MGNDSRELVSFLSELAISTHKISGPGVGRAEKELSGLAASFSSVRDIDPRVAANADLRSPAQVEFLPLEL
jgi:hypothetical protein